jgi:DNA-binding transcriptional regulator YiaG
MTAPAYDILFLDDAMANLGGMLEYAILDCGFDPDVFFGYFISSGVAEQFERGNPSCVSGMSGSELARRVMQRTGLDPSALPKPSVKDGYGAEYWAGWSLAQYQWARAERFRDLVADGLTISKVLELYLLHQADTSKFDSVADKLLTDNRLARPARLQTLRKNRGLTQIELSVASDVNLRMIQLYEQRRNDINKAEVGTIIRLARALGCAVEDIVEPSVHLT